MSRRKYLIAYDISSNAVRQKLSYHLEKYGKRVQYSIFEIFVDEKELEKIKSLILRLINPETDQVYIYPYDKNIICYNFDIKYIYQRYNLLILGFDIFKDIKRRNKISGLLLLESVRVQRSFFESYLNESEIIRFFNVRIKPYLSSEDKFFILKINIDNESKIIYFGKEIAMKKIYII